MRHFKRIVAIVLLCAAALAAQESHGYVYAGPGGVSTNGETGKAIYGGVGGEGIVGSGFGLGAEGGVIRQVSAGWHGMLALVSTNLYYHFVHTEDRSDPFVTVGYTSVFRGAHHEAGLDPGQASAVNFGGGLNYWFRPRVGVKLEFREHLQLKRGPNASYWSFRLGITFH